MANTKAESQLSRRWTTDEYDREYAPSLERFGYFHKLPSDWRLNLPADAVLWPCDDCTAFAIGTLESVPVFLEMVLDETLDYGYAFAVCCPIEPSQVPATAASRYWDEVKNKRLDRRYPTIGDYFKASDRGLPTLEEYLNWLRLPLGDASFGARFRPQWRVLKSLPPECDRGDDYWRWMIDQMLEKQLGYRGLLEHLARQAFKQK